MLAAFPLALNRRFLLMNDFTNSEAGRHLIVASQYLAAAGVLDEAQRSIGRVLFLPTLELAGQALELMLKASMYWNEDPPQKKGRAGHDITSMWLREANEPVRGHIYRNSIQALSDARATTEYQNFPDSDHNEIDLINKYVCDLATLHGQRGYPLRYPTNDETEAPVTPWLVTTLRMTADDFLKRPTDFKLSFFRGDLLNT